MSRTTTQLELPPVAHIEQYDGPWMIYGPAFKRMLAQVNRIDLAAHISAQAERAQAVKADEGSRYEMLGGGVAVISIEGAMTKYGSSFSRAESTVNLRRAVRQAMVDDDVRGVMIRIDSPGGMVSGTNDLAMDIAALAAEKPCHAYIEDLGASAAYWVASQCSVLNANASALVGSIGTYTYLIDSSKYGKKEGFKAIEIKSAPLKGTGIAPLAEISDAQVDDAQREIMEINAVFASAVKRGRSLTDEQLKQVVDARTHVGENAIGMGLIDGVGTLDEAVQGLMKSAQSPSAVSGRQFTKSQGDNAMAKKQNGLVRPVTAQDEDEDPVTETEEDEVQTDEEEDTTASAEDDDETEAEDDQDDQPAATFRQLKAAIPGASAEFREQCMEDGLSLSAAKDRYIAHLETAKAKPAKPGSGVKPLGTKNKPGAAKGTDPVATFNAEVEKLVAEKGMARHDATARICRTRPDLHRAYIDSTNQNKD